MFIYLERIASTRIISSVVVIPRQILLSNAVQLLMMCTMFNSVSLYSLLFPVDNSLWLGSIHGHIKYACMLRIVLTYSH